MKDMAGTLNRVRLTRRLNLGNYSSWEFEVEVFDEDEKRALIWAAELITRALATVDAPGIDVRRIP